MATKRKVTQGTRAAKPAEIPADDATAELKALRELAEVRADAIKLSELAGAALARLWEGGCRLANFPNDESLDMNLAELNYRAWALRWRLGLSDGVGGADDAERDLEVLKQAAEAKRAVAL